MSTIRKLSPQHRTACDHRKMALNEMHNLHSLIQRSPVNWRNTSKLRELLHYVCTWLDSVYYNSRMSGKRKDQVFTSILRFYKRASDALA